jgi:hypothetical protein
MFLCLCSRMNKRTTLNNVLQNESRKLNGEVCYAARAQCIDVNIRTELRL